MTPANSSSLAPQDFLLKLRNVLYVVLSLAVICIPTVFTFLFLRYHMEYPIEWYTPTWVDETIYWHEALTFAHVGFGGGYYTFDEQPAVADFSHFDAHGPLFPILLGSLARIFGWSYYSAAFANLLFISLSVAIFLLALRPNFLQIFLTGALLCTFYPLMFFMLDPLQEVLHNSFAFVIATIITFRYTRPEASPRLRWLGIGFIFVASIFRVSWAFVFIPLLLLDPALRTLWRFILALVLTAVLGLGAYALFTTLNAQIPFSFMASFTQELKYNPSNAFQMLLNHIPANLEKAQYGDPFEIFIRQQYAALLTVVLALFILQVIPPIRKRLHSLLPAREAAFHVLNLGVLFVVQVVLYDMQDWRDFRVFAPVLLLSLVVLISFRRYWLVILMIASSLLVVQNLTSRWGAFVAEKFRYDRQELTDFAGSIEGYLEYDTTTQNGWCNTVGILYFRAGYIALPPGVGFTKFENAAYIGTMPRSRFMVMPLLDYLSIHQQVNFEYLNRTPFGNLYLNRDAECPPWTWTRRGKPPNLRQPAMLTAE